MTQSTTLVEPAIFLVVEQNLSPFWDALQTQVPSQNSPLLTGLNQILSKHHQHKSNKDA